MHLLLYIYLRGLILHMHTPLHLSHNHDAIYVALCLYLIIRTVNISYRCSTHPWLYPLRILIYIKKYTSIVQYRCVIHTYIYKLYWCIVQYKEGYISSLVNLSYSSSHTEHIALTIF